jgi:hypothetical protein
MHANMQQHEGLCSSVHMLLSRVSQSRRCSGLRLRSGVGQPAVLLRTLSPPPVWHARHLRVCPKEHQRRVATQLSRGLHDRFCLLMTRPSVRPTVPVRLLRCDCPASGRFCAARGLI